MVKSSSRLIRRSFAKLRLNVSLSVLLRFSFGVWSCFCWWLNSIIVPRATMRYTHQRNNDIFRINSCCFFRVLWIDHILMLWLTVFYYISLTAYRHVTLTSCIIWPIWHCYAREKGRYRYAGQWKHGRMHGCGVYEVNERTIYVSLWNVCYGIGAVGPLSLSDCLLFMFRLSPNLERCWFYYAGT